MNDSKHEIQTEKESKENKDVSIEMHITKYTPGFFFG
jgi:hypothetical protein